MSKIFNNIDTNEEDSSGQNWLWLIILMLPNVTHEKIFECIFA